MGWGITLNQHHVANCKRILIAWLGFVAFGLILGARLGPRPDEIAFMLLLPLPLIALYALGCLALGLLRLLWPVRRDWHTRPVLRLFAQAHQRIRDRSR
jgi:Sec-independent protein secretion pathway component TatC